MTQYTYEFWENTDGDVYAVQLQGRSIVGAEGPLEPHQINRAALDEFFFDDEDAEWIEVNIHHFRKIEVK